MKEKKVKNRIIFFVILCMIAIPSILSIAYFDKYDFSHLIKRSSFEKGTVFEPLELKSFINGFSVVADNEILTLMINKETTEIAILDKRNTTIWYSNPEAREKDLLANPLEKSKMSSQIEFNYYNNVRKEMTMNNFDQSIQRGQFALESIQDGVRVTYSIGNLSLGFDAIPTYLKAETLKTKILDKLDAKTAKDLSRRYVESSTKEGFLELNGTAKESVIVMNKLLDAFAQAGYTEEDLKADLEVAGIELGLTKNYVSIPIEYRIVGEQLSVTIPAGEIEETKGMQLGTIDVLKFFGAGTLDEEGYLVVPSGTGGLIYFNNNKEDEDSYLQTVYGIDPIMLRSTRTEVTENARLPLYGIKKGNAAFLAYIQEGDTLANINANVSRKTNSYNYVYPSFMMRSKDTLLMSGVNSNEANMTILQDKHYEGDIVIKYCFLDEQVADYSGMAKYYQNELLRQGVLQENTVLEKSPFYLDLFGIIEKSENFIGFPYDGLVRMTKYKEAEKILDELNEKGVQNVQMRYMGWFNKGVNHDVAKAVRLEKQLGTKKELKALEEKLQSKGGNLYMDAAFQLIYFQSKNYSEVKEAARYLDGFSGVIATYNRAFMRMGANYKAGVFSLVSPNALPKHIDKFIHSYQNKIDIQNLSVRDLGGILTSDKKRNYTIDREAAKHIVNEQLAKLDQNFERLMISGGNAYSLRYANQLINVPDSGNDFFIIDEHIPFYQMVIHGYINYSGDAVNIKENYAYKELLLNNIEYGFAPHFLWTYEETSKMNQTAYEEYYSTHYKMWLQDAVSMYTTFQEIDNEIDNGKMLKHIIHQKNVREVLYDNGVSIYVNYNNQSVIVNGITIDAMSYAVGGKS